MFDWLRSLGRRFEPEETVDSPEQGRDSGEEETAAHDEDDAYAAAGVTHTTAVPTEALAMAALSTTPRVVAP